MIFSIPLFGTYLAREWLWTFSPSLSYVGQGTLVGNCLVLYLTTLKGLSWGFRLLSACPWYVQSQIRLPCELKCVKGMIVGWAVLSPLAKFEGWAPGPVGDMSTGSRGWILWVSLAIMCADSIVSLIPVVVDFVTSTARRWTSHGAQDVPEDIEVETPERLVPLRWVRWGLGTSVVLGTVVLWTIFGNEGIKPWASLLGYAIGGLLSILA